MPAFTAMYKIHDGYIGGSAPQYFTITDDDLYSGMTRYEMEELFHLLMQEHFEQKVHPTGYDRALDEFVGWANEQLDLMKGDE